MTIHGRHDGAFGHVDHERRVGVHQYRITRAFLREAEHGVVHGLPIGGFKGDIPLLDTLLCMFGNAQITVLLLSRPLEFLQK